MRDMGSNDNLCRTIIITQAREQQLLQALAKVVPIDEYNQTISQIFREPIRKEDCH